MSARFPFPLLPRVSWPQEYQPPRGSRPVSPSEIPFVPWREFLDSWFDWKPGEHVSLIGHTGGGKTFLGLRILPLRTPPIQPQGHAVILATKSRDDTLEPLTRKGYGWRWTVARKWPPPAAAQVWTPDRKRYGMRVILWPPFKAPDYEAGQIPVFNEAMASIFEGGNWCVFVDEVTYAVGTLKLGPWLTRFWQQGRSLGISLVGATQRPFKVPLDMYSAPTHLFFWQDNDRNNLDRIGEMGGAIDPFVIRSVVRNLGDFEVLYVNARTGLAVRTKAE